MWALSLKNLLFVFLVHQKIKSHSLKFQIMRYLQETVLLQPLYEKKEEDAKIKIENSSELNRNSKFINNSYLEITWVARIA